MLRISIFSLFVLMSSSFWASAANIEDFFGTFVGTAKMSSDGSEADRDMTVIIQPSNSGFNVTWTSIIYKEDGRKKENKYTISFTPTSRDNIFGSAMKTNVFGKAVPLDPLKGDPYVWSRLNDDTLSVFSLLIDENGDYVVQEYHRSLTNGGLDLEYRRLQGGKPTKSIEAFLQKQ